MELAPDFSIQPLPPVDGDGDGDGVAARAAAAAPNPLGALAGLVGSWTGAGFNVIWRPDSSPNSDHFLELNVTADQIDFSVIPGDIPNRGLLQPDLTMVGLNYLQQIKDANLGAGLHFEPGLWLAVPATSNPKEGPTVA